MADIVLKDRNGNDVQYPGVNYLKVNTTDGGTQGFAAYDPETLKAENLPVGVTVGDVAGALEVPQLLENVPVALDFTNGDMEITAPDGYALKSGIVQKPANLTPANIAKDVDIAGVVGTMEAGGGGGTVEAEEKDVCFYDYDGTRLYSYTAAEALALTELPPLPSHEGLICQGWTHTLEEVQSYISDCDFCDIGAYYTTDDGSSRVYLRINEPAYEKFGFASIKYTVEGGVSIDWGDGNIETLSGGVDAYVSTLHTYEQAGDYAIKLHVAEGCEVTNIGSHSGSSQMLVKKIELSENAPIAYGGRARVSISIPKDYPKISNIMNCPAIVFVMPSIPPTSSYKFSYVHDKVIFPPSISSLNNSMFATSHTMTKVALPPAITTIPDYCFQNNASLMYVAIPTGVTAINQYAFRSNTSLTRIRVPGSVKSLGNYVFNSCNYIKEVDFSRHTSVPTLGTNAFPATSYAYKILVPSSLLSTWKAATNWSTYASNIVGV